MIEKHYQMIAFEVENIQTRENYVFVYNPYSECVSTYETTVALSMPKLKMHQVAPFPFGSPNAYEHFKYLYNKSCTFQEDNDFHFIGWVHPHTMKPLDDKPRIENKEYIINHLNQKFQLFLTRIQNDEIRELLEENAYFAGGCISSLMSNKEVNDYDLFISYNEAKNKIRDYYKNEPNEEYKPTIITDNAITFEDGYQIIIRDCGEPDDVVSKFDYVHCMGWYFPQDDELSVHFDTIKSIKEKELIYNNRSAPLLSSMYRMTKFLSRGWKISRAEQNKLIIAIHKCDVSSLDTMDNSCYYEDDEETSHEDLEARLDAEDIWA